MLHFAALSLAAESVEQPNRYFRTNIGGTLNIFDACGRRRAPAGLLLDGHLRGAGDGAHPQTAPTPPTNPYGASKLAVDNAIGFEAAAATSGGSPPTTGVGA